MRFMNKNQFLILMIKGVSELQYSFHFRVKAQIRIDRDASIPADASRGCFRAHASIVLKSDFILLYSHTRW